MFINATGFYVPEERVDNQHLKLWKGILLWEKRQKR